MYPKKGVESQTIAQGAKALGAYPKKGVESGYVMLSDGGVISSIPRRELKAAFSTPVLVIKRYPKKGVDRSQ